MTLSTRRIKAVFFDADDTIFTVNPSVLHYYDSILREHGFSIPATDLGSAIKKHWHLHMPIYENEPNGYRCSVEQDKFIWQQFASGVVEAVTGRPPSHTLTDQIYNAFARGSSRKVYEGFSPTVEKLKKMGIYIGVFTNNDVRIHSVLQELNLTSYFDIVLTAGEVGYKKPAPEAFKALLAHSNTAPDETLFIGDSLKHDYYGAKQLGLHAALFGKIQPQAVSIDPEEVIHSIEHFNEVIDIVSR